MAPAPQLRLTLLGTPGLNEPAGATGSLCHGQPLALLAVLACTGERGPPVGQARRPLLAGDNARTRRPPPQPAGALDPPGARLGLAAVLEGSIRGDGGRAREGFEGQEVLAREAIAAVQDHASHARVTGVPQGRA